MTKRETLEELRKRLDGLYEQEDWGNELAFAWPRMSKAVELLREFVVRSSSPELIREPLYTYQQEARKLLMRLDAGDEE